MLFFKNIIEDINTVFKKDPAARSILEVLTCYPGLHSVWMYRMAQMFWQHRYFFLGRIVSNFSRFLTGIEIHPGALIGRRFFIDHGSGVVIGETTEIGDDVHMYQSVVLGGVSLEKKKRHPTIGNNVMIGAGTIILGPIKINDNARIGAASLVLKDVPQGAVAVGVPARINVGFSGKELRDLTDNKLPDPIAEAFRFLNRQIETLEDRLLKVEKENDLNIENDNSNEENKKKNQWILSPFNEEFIHGTGI